MDNLLGGSNAFKILSYGVIGLSFLLACLAYRLIAQARGSRAVYASMAFAVVLCVIGFAAQTKDQKKALDEYAAKLEAKDMELTAKTDELNRFRDSLGRLAVVKGQIVVPIASGAVSNKVDCAGTVTGYKSEQGVYIWLAVEADAAIWPHDQPLQINENGSWTARIFQDTNPDFSLLLLAVDEDCNYRIRAWLREGWANGGRFGRLSMSSGMKTLDRIQHLKIDTLR